MASFGKLALDKLRGNTMIICLFFIWLLIVYIALMVLLLKIKVIPSPTKLFLTAPVILLCGGDAGMSHCILDHNADLTEVEI